jgi:hypothetical protein
MHKQTQTSKTLQDQTLKFDPTGTYLITGGLSGLGIGMGEWLIKEQGICHLVLNGRGAQLPEVQSTIHQLEEGEQRYLWLMQIFLIIIKLPSC